MINRIKTLVLLQTGDKLSAAKNQKKIKMIVSLVVKIVIIGVVTFGLNFILGFAKNTLYIPVNRNLLVFIIFITQIVSVIACTIGLIIALYRSKDNQILLAYPAHHNEVFVSKLLVFYLKELYRSLFFLIPFFISFGMINNLGLVYYIYSFLFILILPLFPVLIGALISLPIMIISNFVLNNKIASIIFIIACATGVFFLVRLILSFIPEPPLRILALYSQFIDGVVAFIAQVVKYSLFYQNIGNLLYLQGKFVDVLIMLAVIIGLIALVFTLTMSFYFRIASHSSEIASKKIYKNRHMKVHKNTFFTFVRKETTIASRSFNEILSNYGFLVALPIILYILNYIYSAITKTIIGNNMVVAFDILVSLLMITAANSMSANSITGEGLEFQIMKTAPSDTYKMAWAKIAFNMLISFIFITITIVVLGVFTSIYLQDLLLMYVILVLVDMGHIFWSFQMDLLNPKLHDFSISGNVADNPNIGKSVLYGILTSLFFGGFGFLLLYDDYSSGWIRIILLAVAFFAARLYLFVNYLKAYFKEIEM